MKKAYLVIGLTFFCNSAFAQTNEASAWSCSAQSGLMSAEKTEVRLEKNALGYSVFVTASSGDQGSQWKLDNAKVADKLECKFSAKHAEALYCISNENGWTTLTSEKMQVQSVDQSTGEDKTTNYTNVILSGTSPVLKKFKNSVLKFGATNCKKELAKKAGAKRTSSQESYQPSSESDGSTISAQ